MDDSHIGSRVLATLDGPFTGTAVLPEDPAYDGSRRGLDPGSVFRGNVAIEPAAA
jgi:hypothetical protein